MGGDWSITCHIAMSSCLHILARLWLSLILPTPTPLSLPYVMSPLLGLSPLQLHFSSWTLVSFSKRPLSPLLCLFISMTKPTDWIFSERRRNQIFIAWLVSLLRVRRESIFKHRPSSLGVRLEMFRPSWCKEVRRTGDVSISQRPFAIEIYGFVLLCTSRFLSEVGICVTSSRP